VVSQFFQQLVNAIQLGAIYALIALGYSIVYGVLRLINFAHGDLVMLGSFIAFGLVLYLGLPFVPALLVSMLVIGVLAALIERLAYRPLRNAPRVSAVITALGCGLIIQNAMLIKFAYPVKMPDLMPATTWQIGGVSIALVHVVNLTIALALMVGLDLLIRKSRFGMALRAVSADPKTAALLGVPVDWIITLTFVIGGALGAAAGVLWCAAYPVFGATLGLLIGWKAFIAAVIGGIGNLRGAVLGGFILAAVEVASIALFGSAYRDLVSYSLLLVLLVFLPHGIFGKPAVQKV
jgi:branched-chain amino acid transport system permease protein